MMKAFELGFFSIPVTEIQAAKNFYGKIMGWEFQDRDPNFTYISANENMAGSFEIASKDFSPSENGPLLFFRADFMEKTLARVTEGGGIVKEKEAMEGGARGYTAKILDPFKNTIGFWAPEN
jgi:predicted enzyme related to lactoylglutathione lyase